MTPEAFQLAAAAWITALTAVIGIVCFTIVKLSPTVKQAIDAIESLKQQNKNQQSQLNDLKKP